MLRFPARASAWCGKLLGLPSCLLLILVSSVLVPSPMSLYLTEIKWRMSCGLEKVYQ